MTITYNAPKVAELLGLFPISKEVNSLILQDPGVFTLTGTYPWHLGTSADDSAPTEVAAGVGHAITVADTPVTIWVNLTDVQAGATLSISFTPNGVDENGNVAVPSSGGLFGAKTIVVSTTGDDTAGAASKYAAEFLTVQAAITAAAAGDSVLVRPGAYAITTSIIPKTGVPIYFFPGAVVAITGSPGTPVFYDSGAAVAMQILGYGKFVSADREQCVQLAGSGSSCRFECQEIDFTSVNNTSYPTFSANFGGTKTFNLLFRGPCRTTSILLSNGSPVMVADVEAREGVTAAQILVDSGSTGATRVSITAPSITATVAGNDGVHIDNASTGRYEIDAPDLVCPITFRPTNAACQLHVTTQDHTSQAGSGSPPLSLQHVGETFYRCADCLGITGAPEAIFMQDTATLHLLGGRIRGLDGNAGGHAILTSGAGPKLRLYPGAVLIAGNDMATESISADNTPTVLAMGAIAVNKAANVGVVVAVGSLLVDAAVQ